MTPFCILSELRWMEVVVTTGAINSRAKLQLNHHHQQHPVFYRLDALPVVQPTVSEHLNRKTTTYLKPPIVIFHQSSRCKQHFSNMWGSQTVIYPCVWRAQWSCCVTDSVLMTNDPVCIHHNVVNTSYQQTNTHTHTYTYIVCQLLFNWTISTVTIS